MTEQGVLTVLASLITVKDDINIVRTSENELGFTFISIEDFLCRFGESELTLSSLKDNLKTEDTWLERFTDWNNRGVLPD